MASFSPKFPKRTWRLILWAVAIVILLGGVVAWWQWPTRNGTLVKRSELQKLPEEHLFYPGAVVLGESGNDYEVGVWGRNAAISRHVLGVNATQGEVLVFYERELNARGWSRSARDVAITTSDLDGDAWRRGQLAIQVVILRRDDSRNPASASQYPTAYRLTVVANRP